MSRPETRNERHPVDALSLVAGLLAVVLAVGALVDLDVDGDLVVPVLLVAAGALGLLRALRRPREDDDSSL